MVPARYLKPLEQLLVTFTPEEQKEHNIKSRRTIARFIQKYIKENSHPYTVTSFERRDTGDFVVQVNYVPVVRQRA